MPTLPSTTTAFSTPATEGEFKTFLSDLRAYIAYMLGVNGQAGESIVGALPSGTSMLFVQATAPTGWTRQTTHNDKALRIVSGNTTVSSGGAVPFSTAFARTATDGSSLSSDQLASHGHPQQEYSETTSTGTHKRGFKDNTVRYPYVLGGTTAPPTLNTGSNSAHSHGLDLRVQYVDVIICTKD